MSIRLLSRRDELVCGAMVTSSSKTPTKRISGRQKDIFVFSASRGSSWCRSLQLRRCQLWDLLAPQEVLALVPSMSTSRRVNGNDVDINILEIVSNFPRKFSMEIFDRPTDRPTNLPIEAPCRSLKIHHIGKIHEIHEMD